MTEAQKIIKGYDALRNQRATFDGSLRDITFYVLPEYEEQNKETGGSGNVPDRAVSSTATEAAILLGGNIFSHTVSTGEEWFQLRARDEERNDELKDWLSETGKTALKAIQNSNFNEAFGELCLLYSTYGTGALSTEWCDEKDELIFRNHPINGNIYLTEDHKGRVNGVYRLLRMSADQAVGRYGEVALPPEVTEAAGNPAMAAEKFEFIQWIGRNPDHDPNRNDSASLPWASVHVYKKGELIVRRSGYRTFPFACPRFLKVRDFPYGYGAGHQSLPSIRELNKAEADFIDAYEMEAWAPLWLPDEEAVEVAQIRPRFVGYYDPSKGAPFQMKIGGNAGVLFQRIQQLEQRIERHFFIDVFLSVSQRHSGDRTAREVDELTNEKFSSIGPMVSRLQSECFAPLVERVVDLLIEHGHVEPPPVIEGSPDYRIVYTSRIDSKLAAIEVQQTLRAAQEAQMLLAMETETPGMPMVMNIEDAAQSVLERRNVDARFIVKRRDREEMKLAQAEAQAEAMQNEQMQKMMKPIDPMKAPDDGSVADEMRQLV